MVEDYKRRFSVCLALTTPILALSPTVQSLLGYELEVPGALNILFALATKALAVTLGINRT